MRSAPAFIATIGALALSTAAPAFGHPGTVSAAFASGLVHPVSGLDHIAALFAVGLYGAVLGGRSVWALPLAFVAALLFGAALTFAGLAVPAIEPGIAASLLVLGLLIAGAWRLPLAPGAALVALFAMFHGAAHGGAIEAMSLTYAVGFVVGSTALLGVGIGLGRSIAPTHARLAGAATALIGVAVLVPV